jgi:hypothetical protein
MTRDAVFEKLDETFAKGGQVDGKEVSDNYLICLVVRRFQLEAIESAKPFDGYSAVHGGVLMGECLGQWAGEEDFKGLPQELSYLKYSHEWAVSRSESLEKKACDA